MTAPRVSGSRSARTICNVSSNSAKGPSAPSLIHASIGVPPQSALMSPTGTSSSPCSVRPKKYPTALKPATVSGVHSSHRPWQSLRGCRDLRLGTLNSRMDGKRAEAISDSARADAETGHSMFDWPEHSQTSPIMTFSIVTTVSPATVSV